MIIQKKIENKLKSSTSLALHSFFSSKNPRLINDINQDSTFSTAVSLPLVKDPQSQQPYTVLSNNSILRSKSSTLKTASQGQQDMTQLATDVLAAFPRENMRGVVSNGFFNKKLNNIVNNIKVAPSRVSSAKP